MAINPKIKELVAVGISVATGCKPCTDHHVGVAKKARATDEEIKQAITDGLAVRNTAVNVMEGYALADFGEQTKAGDFPESEPVDRTQALVFVGAAFGVNCVTSLEHYLAKAESAGVSQEEITEITKLAAFIKERAASHVERLVGLSEAA